MNDSSTPVINLTIDKIKPETSSQILNDVRQTLKVFGNKNVSQMHIDGNGSKYLTVYTAPPALIVRVSDHPTGHEEAKNVTNKFGLIAESLRVFSKLK